MNAQSPDSPSPNSQFEKIREKVEAGRRLSAADGDYLFHDDVDLHAVGELADMVRRRKHGDVVYYNLNAHLNPTNVCIYRCSLCAYSCDADDPRAFTMTTDEILARGQEAVDAGYTELHIVGGLHPDKPFEWHLQNIRTIHDALPRLHLKSWSPLQYPLLPHLALRPLGKII